LFPAVGLREVGRRLDPHPGREIKPRLPRRHAPPRRQWWCLFLELFVILTSAVVTLLPAERFAKGRQVLAHFFAIASAIIMTTLHADLNAFVWPYLDVSPVFTSFSGNDKARPGWGVGVRCWGVVGQSRGARTSSASNMEQHFIRSPKQPQATMRIAMPSAAAPSPHPQILYMSGAALCAGWVLLVIFNAAWIAAVLPVDAAACGGAAAGGRKKNTGGPITGAITGEEHVHVQVRS
jgi:hypothetical protein